MARDKTDKTDTTPAATLATTATRAVIEWGIPDWRDAAAYDELKERTVTFMRWRWEFYRRRDDLRAAFDARADQTYRDMAAHYPPWPDGSTGRVLRPDEPGFTARLFHDEAQKFGYAGLPNPRISRQRSHVIFSVLDYPGNNSMMPGNGTRWPGAPEREIGVGNGEIAVVFDLDKPLGPQLSGLKDELKGRQIMRHGKALQSRQHETKWLGYLRTLDARESGASWREIAIALLPMRDDEAGERVHARETKARDLWKAANDLRFNF